MGATLRERDRGLAEAREQALRDERLIALGTLAAGAAHELATPLSTMAVLTKELEREYSHGDDLAGRLRTLREQIDRCKNVLSVLSASAGQVRAESGSRLPVDEYLEQIIGDWRRVRPAVTVRARWSGVGPAPAVLAERTLTQAIMNVLNNAADASPHDVEVIARWDDRQWQIEVYDRGDGLSDAASAHAGKGIFTTKKEGQGLGLGLFLAHSTIGRFGGSVQLFNRDGGGACTRIILPLTRLSAAA
jgi:two-component system sensor histidine kinase RegB